MIGGTEWIVIAAVALVLFGGAAIPKFARSLGKARKEFKKGMEEGEAEADRENEPSESGVQSRGRGRVE